MGLTIYKASAGSGKTYTLVKAYLDLLLQSKSNDTYRSILVATFTNKATSELRERIVRELRERMQRGGAEGMRARQVLEQILLDYDALRVQTIDSFFQEVVRSFAFELLQTGANASADVDLDRDSAIELSVDQLLVRLDGEELQWIEQLLVGKAEEGENIDLRGEVVKLAKKILYNPNARGRDLSGFDASKVQAAMDELRAKRKTILAEVGEQFVPLREWLEAHKDILEHSKLKFLLSLYQSELDKLLRDKYSNPDKLIYHGNVNIDKDVFIVSTSLKDPEMRAKLISEQSTVKPLLQQAQAAVDANWQEFQLAEILLQHLSLLPLFSSLQETIKRYQEEHNIILIDEINFLLDQVIAGASAPFIYERVGGRIRHYMIDEFQDTSGIQWDNFRALLLEAIAQQGSDGHSLESYLVGDVKQSIYRFRGTDSSLLNSGVEQDEDFKSQITSCALENNWRSDHNIVEFNNQFFYDSYHFGTHTDGKISSHEFDKIYKPEEEKEVKQGKRYNGGEGRGYVRFEYIEKPKGDEESAELRARLRETLLTLQRDEGYQAGDIAFIVRKNEEAEKIADMLTSFAQEAEEGEQHYYSFISDEALKINNAQTVRLLTSLFQLLGDPGNSNYQTLYEVACLMLGLMEQEEQAELLELCKGGRSLLEIAHTVLRKITVPMGEELYVNAFLDLLFEYTQNNIATYQQFGEWWRRVGIGKEITMGRKTSDRIQILTIHKAKGLEFPIVIMPYVGWKYYNNNAQMIEILGKDELPEGFLSEPLDFYLFDGKPNKSHLNSLLSNRYNKILEEIYLDQLNLLYVAFTRPINRLYLFTHEADKVGSNSNSLNNVSIILYDRLKTIEGIQQTGNVWTFGHPTPKREPAETCHGPLVLNPHYKRELPNLPELRVAKPTSESAIYGITMHDAMARALTPEQFRDAIQRLGRADEAELFAHFDQALQDPLVASWFAPTEERKILVEQRIGTAKGTYRPDRVVLEGNEATVIDFKFAHPLLEHRAQVLGYMELLRKLGYSVRGYLWYWHQTQQIQEVK